MAVTTAFASSSVSIAEPRESPGAASSPATDISAVYAFRSWADPDKLVLIMNVAPGQQPDNGPAFTPFDDDVLYRIHVDTDGNGVAENIVYDVQFTTHMVRRNDSPLLPLPYVGSPGLAQFPPITALSGYGSEGIALRQTYSVTERIGKAGRSHATRLFAKRTLIAAPTNAGANIMPDYESLAAQAIYKDERSGVRVFAGPRAETVYRDVAAIVDGLNFRRYPPFLSEAEDNDQANNPFGKNRFAGNNVNSIAIEVPINRITLDGKDAAKTAWPLIGVYGSVERRKWSISGDTVELMASQGGGSKDLFGPGRSVQVSRLANPMIDTFVIPLAVKDVWNQTSPQHEARFERYIGDPLISKFLQELFGVPVPPAPRIDLMQVLYKYPGQNVLPTGCGSPCSDLLRLNLQVPPTPADRQHRMGALLSPDPAGLPNGRRPNDDITDIGLRALGGPAYFAVRLGDGVNFAEGMPGAGTNDGLGYGVIRGNRLDVTANGIAGEFPFLPTPHSANP